MISKRNVRPSWLVQATFCCASVVLSLSLPVRAEEIKVFDTPPSVDELRDAMGVTRKPGVRTRSIQIDGPGAPAAPAPASTSSPSSSPDDEPAQRPSARERPQSQQPAASEEARERPRPHRPAASSASESSSSKPVAMHIQFDVGSAALRPGSEAFIESIAKIMIEEKQYTLTIEGHTDASGQFAKNLALSMARANTVRDVMVKKFGIDASRLTAVGKGPSQPLKPSNPFDPANRRVQFELKG